jgi:hypothetical protein
LFKTPPAFSLAGASEVNDAVSKHELLMNTCSYFSPSRALHGVRRASVLAQLMFEINAEPSPEKSNFSLRKNS